MTYRKPEEIQSQIDGYLEYLKNHKVAKKDQEFHLNNLKQELQKAERIKSGKLKILYYENGTNVELNDLVSYHVKDKYYEGRVSKQFPKSSTVEISIQRIYDEYGYLLKEYMTSNNYKRAKVKDVFFIGGDESEEEENFSITQEYLNKIKK